MDYSPSERRFITPPQRAEIRAAIARDPERLAERYIPAGLVRLGRRGQEIEWNASRKQRGGGNHRFRIKLDGDRPLFTDFTHSPALAGRGVNFIAKAEGIQGAEIWRAYQIAAEIYGIETGLEAEEALPAHIRAERQRQIEASRAKAEADREAQEQLEREAHAAAASAARAVMDASQPATSHPYTLRKNVSCAGLFVATRTIRARLYSPTKGEWFLQAVAAEQNDLVIPVHDASGNLINIQRINRDSTKLFLSGGLKKGGFHIIPGIEPGFIVEGYATGATVHEATGRMVVVAFDAGQLPTVAALLAGRIASVAADNDETGAGKIHADKTGLDVRLPPDVGTDWNDCAAARGLDYVREALALAPPPEPPKKHPPLAEVRQRIEQDMRRIVGEITGPDREQNRAVLFPVGVGIGKTRAAFSEGLRAYDAARTQARATGSTVGPIVISVPDHGLSRQAADDIASLAEGMGISVTVRRWFGRGVKDATTGAGDMCREREKADAIRRAGCSVTDQYCIKKVGGCPYAAGCPYLAQGKAKADVWIITHAQPFIDKPKNIETPFLLVIDERFYQSGIAGMPNRKGGRPTTREGRGRTESLVVTGSGLSHEDGGYLSREDIGNLLTETRRAADMLHRAAQRGDSLLPVSDITETGFTIESLSRFLDGDDEAAGLFSRAEGAIKNGLDLSDDQALIDAAKALAPIVKARVLFREMRRVLEAGDETAVRIELYAKDEDRQRIAEASDDNAKQEGLSDRPHGYAVTGRKDIAEGWKAPTVILDATAQPEIVRLFFPNLEAAPPYLADEPHTRRLKVKSPRFRWNMTTQKHAKDDHERRLNEAEGDLSQIAKPARQAASFERFIEVIRFHWVAAGRRSVLCVMTKAMHDYIERLKETGIVVLPKNVDTIYPAIVAGRNDWKDVPTILMMTRTLPQAREVESIARALTGKPVTAMTPQPLTDGAGVEHGKVTSFIREDRQRTTTTGEDVTVQRYTHPDPMADALLREITEGGMIQADGRGRGVTRTADNPLTVIYYADTFPEDLPLDDVIDDKSAHPVAWMLAATGYATTSPTDAGRLFPDFWGNTDAAKDAFRRGTTEGGFSINNLNIEFPPSVLLCRYRPEGERQKWRIGYVVSGEEAAFVGALTANLGKPIQIEGDGITPPPSPAPTGQRQAITSSAPEGVVEPFVAVSTAQEQRNAHADNSGAERAIWSPPWRSGGIIDRASSASWLRPDARATGHEMGAADDLIDPALEWMMTGESRAPWVWDRVSHQ